MLEVIIQEVPLSRTLGIPKPVVAVKDKNFPFTGEVVFTIDVGTILDITETLPKRNTCIDPDNVLIELQVILPSS